MNSTIYKNTCEEPYEQTHTLSTDENIQCVCFFELYSNEMNDNSNKNQRLRFDTFQFHFTKSVYQSIKSARVNNINTIKGENWIRTCENIIAFFFSNNKFCNAFIDHWRYKWRWRGVRTNIYRACLYNFPLPCSWLPKKSVWLFIRKKLKWWKMSKKYI